MRLSYQLFSELSFAASIETTTLNVPINKISQWNDASVHTREKTPWYCSVMVTDISHDSPCLMPSH